MSIKIIKAESKESFRQVAYLHRDGITEGFLSTLGISFLSVLYRGIAKAENSGVLVAVEENLVDSRSMGDGKERAGSVLRHPRRETTRLCSPDPSERMVEGEEVDGRLLIVDGCKKEGEGGLVDGEANILGFISYSQDVKSCYKHVLTANCLALSFAMILNLFKPSIYKKVFETLLYPFLHKDKAEAVVESKTDVLHPELLSMAVSENARGKGIGKLLVKAVDDEMKKMGVEGYYVVTHGIDERSNGFYQRCGFAKVHEFVNHGKPMNEYYKKLG